MRTQINLIVIVLFSSLFLIGCGTNETASTPLPKQANAKLAVEPTAPSCAAPTAANVQECAEIENSILASTVRIEMRELVDGDDGAYYKVRGVSHGTVKDGRYLITHNHFPIPLSQMQTSAAGERIKVSIYRVDGEIVLENMPLKSFNIAFEDEQLLIFDFLSYGDQGLFEIVGLPSAQFVAWEDANLQVGDEVAQLNWNGEVARVEWAHVTSIHNQNGAPHIELDNFLEEGASGGGVFLNGVHIANNWARMTELDNSGAVVSQYSIAALNVISVEI